MSKSNRSVRVRTDFSGDSYLSVNLEEDISNLEILSLNISTDNFYKTHNSKYGCVVGRVLANDAVGIPNAKISVFISADSDWLSDSIFSGLYSYTDISSKNSENIRYNLLPSEQVSTCHTPVGTFPSKRMVLDDSNYVEVYDKFYKYTTVSNKAGDYMLFGVPTGDTIIHTDIDLSDIGFLSQRPRDMIYKGYDSNKFENANKFKSSTNLDDLAQIIQENDSVNVASFWGEGEDENVKITRNDINVDYEFTPTCVFLGSLVTDNSNESISKKCIPSERMGKMDKLTTGAGTIEMIRKKSDGSVEEYQVQGTQLIDGNGTWCYQIPMNLDYVKTDEYGNIVPCEDPNKGIPTRTRVRFRISLNDFESDYGANHLVKVLVPNNPLNYEDVDYHFGSYTKDDENGGYSFRDLFWNNVYTVKSYIPRIQKGNSNKNKRFTGFKAVNINGGNNPIPYNNMRVKITFMFTLQCAIIKALIWLMKIFNRVILKVMKKLKQTKSILGKVFTFGLVSGDISSLKCYYVGDSVCPDMEGWYFAPSCTDGDLFANTWRDLKDEDSIADSKSTDYENKVTDETICLTNKVDYLIQCIEINLAQEYEVINFDFYNDWINGMVYIPYWNERLKKRRRHKRSVLQSCSETYYNERRITQQCALTYSGDSEGFYTDVVTDNGCDEKKKKERCHKSQGRKFEKIFKYAKNGGGLLHTEETLKGEKAYYFKPCEWHRSYDGTYENRCILFATDLVLLGSLNDCDNDGIPQAFKYLTSTSYVMPTNLAKTNMDSEGYMYGHSDGSSVCSGSLANSGVEVISSQTFNNYVKWTSKLDYYEATPDDVTEYAVTEASGIDWGYSGPNQGSNSGLYRPGGHFLGISCINTQTNIKSCVNLSRICEIGSDMSSRDYIVLKNGDDYSYAYIKPTGLISRDELMDGSFRGMFATLNSNRLKTRIDTDTNNRIYDFIPLDPRNFNGELKNKVSTDTNYNVSVSVNDDEGGSTDSTTQLITRTLENRSNDYYRFRFGLGDKCFLDDDGKATYEMMKHYLIYNQYAGNDTNGRSISANTVSMPVYENSYYFYFGLKDGNTSLDRLFNNFYASCDSYDEDSSYFMIDVKDTSFCDSYEGSIHIDFNNIDSPYTITINRSGVPYYFYETSDDEGNVISRISTEIYYKVLYKENGNDDILTKYLNQKDLVDFDTSKIIYSATSETYYTNDSTLDIEGFYGTNEGITYDISLSSSDGQSKDLQVIIGQDTMAMSSITVETHDFVGTIDDNDPIVMWGFCKEYMQMIQGPLYYKKGKKSKEDPDYIGYISLSGVEDKMYSGTIGILGFAYLTDEYYTFNLINGVNDIFYKSNGYDDNENKAKNDLFGDRTELVWNLPQTFTDDTFGATVYAWSPNENYKVYAIYYCGDYKVNLVDLGTFNIGYDMPIDLYIGDSDLLYNNTIKKLIDKTTAYTRLNWYNAFLHQYAGITSRKYLYIDGSGNLIDYETFKGVKDTDENDYVTSITPKQVWNVKKALFFENSCYVSYSDYTFKNNIIVGPTGGTSDTTLVILGAKERLIETEKKKYGDDSDNDETVTYEERRITTPREYFSSNQYFAENKAYPNNTSYQYEDAKKTEYSLSIKDILIPTFGINYYFGDLPENDKRYYYEDTVFGKQPHGVTNPSRGYSQFDTNFDNYYRSSIEGADSKSLFTTGSEDRSTPRNFRGGKVNYGIMAYDGSTFHSNNTIKVPEELTFSEKTVPTSDKDSYSEPYYPSVKYFLTTPSIYMPFFFNTLFVIDSNKKVYVKSIINNGITYPSKLGEDTIYKFSSIIATVNGQEFELRDEFYREDGDFGNVFESGKTLSEDANPVASLDIASSLYDNLPYTYSFTNKDYYPDILDGTGIDIEVFEKNDYQIDRKQNCNSYTEVDTDLDGASTSTSSDFSFSVTEGYPDGFTSTNSDFSAVTITKSTNSLHFADENGDSGNIRYQLISSDKPEFIKNLIRSYSCYGTIHGNLSDGETEGTKTQTDYSVPDGYYTSTITTANTYSGVYSAPFEDIKPRTLEEIIQKGLVKRKYDYGKWDKYGFTKEDLSETSTTDIYNFVVGIYDDFTKNQNYFENENPEQYDIYDEGEDTGVDGYEYYHGTTVDNSSERNKMWNKYPKDGNLLSVVKIYTWDDFQKIINNIVNNSDIDTV